MFNPFSGKSWAKGKRKRSVLFSVLYLVVLTILIFGILWLCDVFPGDESSDTEVSPPSTLKELEDRVDALEQKLETLEEDNAQLQTDRDSLLQLATDTTDKLRELMDSCRLPSLFSSDE